MCVCLLRVVTVSLLAGSEPVARPIVHFDMDTDEATQTSARTDIQHPWLEYSVWQEREWVRIYIPGQSQLRHPDDEVPDLPENTFREWKRATAPGEETHEPGQAWTLRDWQHQGYQRVLTRYESFSTHHALDQPLAGLHNPDISIQVEELGPLAWSSSAKPRNDGYVHLRPAHVRRCTSIISAPSAGLQLST